MQRAIDLRDKLSLALRAQGVNSLGLLGPGFEANLGHGVSAILSDALKRQGLGDLRFKVGVRDPVLPWTQAEAPVSRDVAACVKKLLGDERSAA